MKHSKAKPTNKQAGFRLVPPASSHNLIREVLRQELHCATLRLVHELFQEEITALCGPRHGRHRDAEGVRGGSEQGSIRWDGKRIPLRRPRAKDADGEVTLESYAALNDCDT